jgi:hypothetical protein
MAFTEEQLALRIKDKYPQYQGLDNSELVSKVLDKYPEYGAQLTEPEQRKNTLRDVGKTVISTLTGQGPIGPYAQQAQAFSPQTTEGQKLIASGFTQGVLGTTAGLIQTGGEYEEAKTNFLKKAEERLLESDSNTARTLGQLFSIRNVMKDGASESAFENAERIRDISRGVDEFLNIDPEAANTFGGQILRGFGNFGSFLGPGVVGKVVGLGGTALTGTNIANTYGQMVTESIMDAEDTLGKSYTQMNEDERNQVALSSAGHGVIGTALNFYGARFSVPWMKGFLFDNKKVPVGELRKFSQQIKEIGKGALKGFMGEGFTEALEGLSVDSFAKALYDDDRMLMSYDALKRRANEFLIGGIIGGTVRGSGTALDVASNGPLVREQAVQTQPDEYVQEPTQPGERRQYEVAYSMELNGETKEVTDTIEATSPEEAAKIYEDGFAEGSSVPGMGFKVESVQERGRPEPTPAPGPGPTEQPRLPTPADITVEAARNPRVMERAAPLFEKLKAKQPVTVQESRELARVVDEEIPVEVFDEQTIESRPILTNEQMATKLSDDKVDFVGRENFKAPVQDGDFVASRLDIPAYEKPKDKGAPAFIVTIHQASPTAESFQAGPPLGYDSTAVLDNVTFGIGYGATGQKAVLGIASGKNKGTIATMRGTYVDISPEQAYAELKENLNNPEWIQVGMDPERRGYFYNRKTMREVLGAERVIQVGKMVLAKNVKYGPTPANEFVSRLTPGLVVDEADVTAEAAPIRNNVSVEAAAQKIKQEGLAKEVNENFFVFWTRVLDSVGKRYKASPRNFPVIAKQAVQDVMQFFKDNPKFATYYQTDAALTRSYVEAVTGPITDSEFTLFRVLAGLTSPSTNLPDNLIDTLRVFKLYKEKGDFNFIVPSKTEKGARTYDKEATGFAFRSTTGATKSTSILALQQKIDEIGLDATLEYLVEPATMQELVAEKRKLGYKNVNDKGKIRKVVKEATGQDKLIPRIFMFGPKVGAYSMNTMGYNEYTTTDIWESRFIRSYFKGMFEAGTGLPVGVDEQKIFQEFASNFNKEFEKQTGLKLDPADLQAVRWFYILNTFKQAGYAYAKTDDTISGYTANAARKLYGINPEGGRPSVGEDTSEVFAEASAGNRAFNEPLQDATTVSQEYSRSSGIPFQEPERITEVNVERAQRIGRAFDEMTPAPNDPEVRAAYDAMVMETLAQYETILRNGYSIEINNTEPYNNSQEMIEDLRNRKVMRVFSTEFGFGEGGITAKERAENPLLAETGLTDVNGVPLLVNDVFRFVHDFFGHAKLGNGFGPIGEENAWNVHSRMYSPLARKAMTTETRGQNSWVNFSGVNDAAFEIRDQAREARRQGREEEANRLTARVYDEMRFADQKIGLLPDEFVRTDDEVVAEAGTVLRPDEQPVEGGFNTRAEMDQYITEEFLPVAQKLGFDIVPNFAAPVARYNVTQQAIEYNPRELFKQSKDYVRSAMREEIIHASMHRVLMNRNKNISPEKAWLNFFNQVGKDLTPEQRTAIEQVYRNLSDDVSYGAEYTRALIQQQLYGRLTEQDLRYGPAFEKIVQLIKSVQLYITRALKGMSGDMIEAAAVIKESTDLLLAFDPNARPVNQATVAAANRDVQEDAGILTAEVAVDLGKPPKKRKTKPGELNQFDLWINSGDTVLRRIHPEIANLFQDYTNRIREKTFDALKRAKPFYAKYNKIKNKKDKARLKQLLMYSPLKEGQEGDAKLLEERDALLRKYDMYNLAKTNLFPVLFRIRSEAQIQGIDIGFLEGYHPRRVIDYPGLRESYGRPIARDFRSYIEEINRQRSRRNLEEGRQEPLVKTGSEEEALIFEKYIRNGEYTRRGVKTRKPRAANQRTIELIPTENLQFYDDPGSAFEYYISSMIHATETMRFFGERFFQDGDNIRLSGEMGPLLQNLLERGEIDDEAAFTTLPQVAKMLLGPASRENAFLGYMRQFSYFTAMVELTSTLSNLLDLPFMMQRTGFVNLMRSMFSEKDLRLLDFAIDNDRISEEFRDEKNYATAAVKLGLKASGFTRLDQLVKETSINAMKRRLELDAKHYYKDRNSNRSKRFRTTVEEGVGRDNADAAIAALKKGDINNVLVRTLVLRESLEKTQPISQMQLPIGFSANPNTRFIIQMKSFMVAQLNYTKTQLIDKMVESARGGNKAQATYYASQLMKLLFFLVAAGMPIDIAKDFLAGRLGYMSDYLFNGIFRLAGISKYQVYQTKKEGIVGAIFNYFTPIGMQQAIDYGAEMQRVIAGDKAVTDSKLVSILPFTEQLNRIFGWSRERERREYIRRRREGELPTFIPPGAL